MRTTHLAMILLLCGLLSSCGGGGSEESPADDLQDLSIESFVYELMHVVYLYNEELPHFDPESYEDPAAVLDAMVVGPPRDRWSYVAPAAALMSYFDAGEYLGWGFTSAIDADGWIRLALVQADGPAGRGGLARGDAIVAIDDVDCSPPIDPAAFQAALGPEEAGYEATFTLRDRDGGVRSVTMAKDMVTIDPVPHHAVHTLADDSAVGYLVFHDFITPANDALTAAVADFGAAGVDQVVVDLRYNRGGSMAVARHCASLLNAVDAAPMARADLLAFLDRSTSDVFCTLNFNDTGWHPTGIYRFYDLVEAIAPERIVFLVSANTASASEALINGLLPYREVVVIGETTLGKPVGMNIFVHENTDTALVPITFQLLNALGAGDYFAGIEPDALRADDLEHDLGDTAEALLATALTFLETGSFPAQPAAVAPSPQPVDDLYPAGMYRAIGKH